MNILFLVLGQWYAFLIKYKGFQNQNVLHSHSFLKILDF